MYHHYYLPFWYAHVTHDDLGETDWRAGWVFPNALSIWHGGVEGHSRAYRLLALVCAPQHPQPRRCEWSVRAASIRAPTSSNSCLFVPFTVCDLSISLRWVECVEESGCWVGCSTLPAIWVCCILDQLGYFTEHFPSIQSERDPICFCCVTPDTSITTLRYFVAHEASNLWIESVSREFHGNTDARHAFKRNISDSQSTGRLSLNVSHAPVISSPSDSVL